MLLLATASAFDRVARRNELLIPGIPPQWLGAGAMTSAAVDALNGGEAEDARELAEAAVRRQPLDQPALRTLGLATLATGDTARASEIMRIAGALGWRDPDTQLFWARVAVASGDNAVAAQRLDAVMRMTSGLDPRGGAMIGALAATPEGRVAVITRLRDAPLWPTAYFPEVDSLPDAALPGRAALVEAAIHAHVAGGDAKTAALLESRLVARNRPDLAYSVWSATRRPGQAASSVDVAFAGAGDEAAGGPFAWSLPPSFGLTASFDPGALAGSANALRIVSSNAARVLVAARLLRLVPGNYRLRLTISAAKTAHPLQAEIYCIAPNTGVKVDEDAGTSDVHAFQFSIAPGCVTQRLELWVNGEEGRRDARLTVDAIALERIAGTVAASATDGQR